MGEKSRGSRSVRSLLRAMWASMMMPADDKRIVALHRDAEAALDAPPEVVRALSNDRWAWVTGVANGESVHVEVRGPAATAAIAGALRVLAEHKAGTARAKEARHG